MPTEPKQLSFFFYCCQHHISYIQSVQLSWHPNVGSEQVAGAMMKTKQWTEQVDG